ncbi:MAG TPA: methyltransferase [Candidatus Binatia bacterium]|nr:methyltransferase [Candidatus Binatia bacterium]
MSIEPSEAEEVFRNLPGEPIRLLRVGNLDQLVDGSALLSNSAVPEPPYWAHLWPSARVLAQMLSAEGPRLRGRRVIEVGCGLGLPGLVAARCGASVVLTDRNQQAITFAGRSVARNRLSAVVLSMDWRASPLRASFDLCLVADATYDPSTNDHLVEFAERHLAPDGEVWVAESVRAEEAQLPRLLADRFDLTVQRIPATEEGRRVWVRVLQGRRR